MSTGKPLSKELIQRIREEVLQGKNKYRVAKEMGINESVVRNHTRDLSSLKHGEPNIKGKAVDLLKQLLEVGYVNSTTENYLALQRLRSILPMIQQTRIDYKRVYYLSDKNKIALQAMITRNKSRIISYQELKSISKVFGVNLSREEKHEYAITQNGKDLLRFSNEYEKRMRIPVEQQKIIEIEKTNINETR